MEQLGGSGWQLAVYSQCSINLHNLRRLSDFLLSICFQTSPATVKAANAVSEVILVASRRNGLVVSDLGSSCWSKIGGIRNSRHQGIHEDFVDDHEHDLASQRSQSNKRKISGSSTYSTDLSDSTAMTRCLFMAAAVG